MTDKLKEIIIEEILKAVKDKLDRGELAELVFNAYKYEDDTYDIDMGQLEEYYGNTVADEIERYKSIAEETLHNDIWFIADDIFKKHLLNNDQVDDISSNVLDALIENNLDEISILEEIISHCSFKEFIEKYDNFYAEEVRQQRVDEERVIYEQIRNNKKILDSIYKDYLRLLGDTIQKYNNEDIELLKIICKILLRKHGRKNMEIFVESDYFKKSVSNSIFERFPLIIRTLK